MSESLAAHRAPSVMYYDRLMERLSEVHRDGPALRVALAKMDGVDPERADAVRRELLFFTVAGKMAAAAKIVLMQAAQGREFLDVGRFEQDFVKWLRLPYEHVFVEFYDGSFRMRGYQGEYIRGEVDVRAVLISETSQPFLRFDDSVREPRLVAPQSEGYVRSFFATFWFPLVGATDKEIESHSVSFYVSMDNRLIVPAETPEGRARIAARGSDPETYSRIVDWALHCINFLSSPTVALEPVQDRGTTGRKASMRAAGIEPPKGEVLPHVIVYRRWHHAQKDAVGQPGSKHSFRYDVRGHFKRFLRGRMAGRVVWCPAHQRGLANELYRPKRYVT